MTACRNLLLLLLTLMSIAVKPGWALDGPIDPVTGAHIHGRGAEVRLYARYAANMRMLSEKIRKGFRNAARVSLKVKRAVGQRLQRIRAGRKMLHEHHSMRERAMMEAARDRSWRLQRRNPFRLFRERRGGELEHVIPR